MLYSSCTKDADIVWYEGFEIMCQLMTIYTFYSIIEAKHWNYEITSIVNLGNWTIEVLLPKFWQCHNNLLKLIAAQFSCYHSLTF